MKHSEALETALAILSHSRRENVFPELGRPCGVCFLLSSSPEGGPGIMVIHTRTWGLISSDHQGQHPLESISFTFKQVKNRAATVCQSRAACSREKERRPSAASWDPRAGAVLLRTYRRRPASWRNEFGQGSAQLPWGPHTMHVTCGRIRQGASLSWASDRLSHRNVC